MSHHANDGSASRALRSLLQDHGYRNDPRPELAAAAEQDAKCARGEHLEAVAEPRRVTYIGFGVRVEPGTRYCRRCKKILSGPSSPPFRA